MLVLDLFHFLIIFLLRALVGTRPLHYYSNTYPERSNLLPLRAGVAGLPLCDATTAHRPWLSKRAGERIKKCSFAMFDIHCLRYFFPLTGQ